LVRRREVVCVNGYAVILKHDISELLISRYKIGLSRNLADALRKRSNFADEEEEESETSNVYSMVDTFLTRFVSDPGDALKETPQGVVLHSDIPTLAKLHMPLCMSRVDRHLRETGHLKHHGRWMLGLFLKSIGLSLDSSIQYWSDLMTLKGGGGPGKTVEAFKKGTYGYGLRHMYGQEGKRTSYSSMSCASILEMPPQMDKHDCHGCPFKFRDEGLLRHLLSGEKINPATMQPVHLAQSDIEDIVKDAKGSHYTRACYKYYVATHPGIPRDNLFRSPYEYYSVSLDVSKAGEKQRGVSAGSAAPAGSSPQAPGNATPSGRQGEVKTEGDPNPPSARRTLQFPTDASPSGTK
jgi:DNA primase large subunit